MDDIDRIATRVTLAGCVGAVGGSALALFKGNVVPRTAALTAMSCAMTATACFCSERLANQVANKLIISHDGTNPSERFPTPFEQIMASHAAGGILGGALTGTLYIGRPLRGIIFVTPLMILVGIAEFKFQNMRERRTMELMQQRKISESYEISK
jgi:hypothetical protein